ncbi:hypothetical protein ACFL42_01040 [Candidatus Omnitrophota bacterium]
MSNVSLYKRIYWITLTLSAVLVAFFILAMFFIAPKAKEVRFSFTLMENLVNAQVETIIYELLEESITQDDFTGWDKQEGISAEEGAEDLKVILRNVPILDRDWTYPVNAHLSVNGKEIPFRGDRTARDAFASWDFMLERDREIFRADAADMSAGSKSVVRKRKSGNVIIGGGIIKPVDIDSGFFEFLVYAANTSVAPSYRSIGVCQMGLTIDGVGLKKVNVADRNFKGYSFFGGTTGKLTNIGINLMNASTREERKKGFAAKLSVKEVGVYKVNPTVFFDVKGPLKDQYRSPDISLVYFKSFLKKGRDDLIRFYKDRFEVEDLRNIVNRENPSPADLLYNIQVGGLTKYALFAPAPTEIRIKLDVPEERAKMVFSFGIMEDAYDKPGDGVEFRVRQATGPNEPEVTLFLKYINPKKNQEDRKWFQGDVDLSRYAGEEVVLIFETIGSTGSEFMTGIDDAYDYAVWSS